MNDHKFNTLCINRPRIEKILESMANGKLIYVIAGAGYGKTQIVQSFLEKQPEAILRFIGLTEGDNQASYFWDRLMRSVSLDNDELADKLTKLGFPKSLVLFKQFTEILKTTEYRADRIFLVLDDFHQISDKNILTFAERMVHMNMPNLCVIIISRQEPKLNTISLFAKTKAGIITEEDLCFTKEEIGEFLSLHGVSYKPGDLEKYYDATLGWAMGVRFLYLALKRSREYPEIAINTMKSNVFKLFEAESFENFSIDVKKILVKLSLVSDIPLAPLFGITSVAGFIENNHELASFVWYDSLSGDFKVHPLYLTFLQQNHSLLTNDEILDAYSQAAIWCKENGYIMNASEYFAKSMRYDEVLKILFSCPHKMPHDTCAFYLNIIKNMPPNENDPSYAIIISYFYPLMLTGMSKHEEAASKTYMTISKWENIDSTLAYTILYLAYSNLAYFDMYTCTSTHKYEAPKHIIKSMEYLKLANLPQNEGESPFSVPNIRSYACLVGENAELSEFEEFLAAAKETVAVIADTNHKMFYGYDDLVACEIHYYKNELSQAKIFAHNAIKKAREKNQSSVEALTRKYLLRMAIHTADYGLAEEVISKLTKTENPGFWNHSIISDLIMGSFYALIGCPKLSPPWLTMTKNEAKNEVSIPIAELAVTLINYIAAKKYDRVLTVLSNSYPRSPYDRFLFSELHFYLISSIAKINTGDTSGSLEDFKKAYKLSFNGVFEMFFIEMGKHLHPVTNAISKQKNTGINKEWLNRINRKASIFAKKAANFNATLNTGKNNKETISLSSRELEVISDLYQGLTREEIAENRFLSINTVKKILQSIFIKLDAANSAQAIRIAVEKKLVE